MGLQRYIERQLYPERILNAAVEGKLSGLTTITMSSREIAERYQQPLAEARRQRRQAQQAGNPNDQDPARRPQLMANARQAANLPFMELSEQKVLRAIYSERQLEEVLTDFWFNHFNVDARKGPVRYLLTEYEREAIRPHVLGNFRDLLEATAMSQLAQFGIRGGNDDALGASFEAQYAAAADRVLNGTGRETFEAIRTLKTADPLRYEPEHGADYPRTPFGQALKQIAQLSPAGLGLEVAFAELGGWDTHVNQGAAQGQLAARFDDFARGIAALVTDLGKRMDDTVVLTMSEFGRAVSENGNRGTDHGHGNAMMVLGGGVRGGRIYGKWPGLAREHRYEGRDLAVTTDFRDVFAEIVV